MIESFPSLRNVRLRTIERWWTMPISVWTIAWNNWFDSVTKLCSSTTTKNEPFEGSTRSSAIPLFHRWSTPRVCWIYSETIRTETRRRRSLSPLIRPPWKKCSSTCTIWRVCWRVVINSTSLLPQISTMHCYSSLPSSAMVRESVFLIPIEQFICRIRFENLFLLGLIHSDRHQSRWDLCHDDLVSLVLQSTPTARIARLQCSIQSIESNSIIQPDRLCLDRFFSRVHSSRTSWTVV